MDEKNEAMEQELLKRLHEQQKQGLRLQMTLGGVSIAISGLTFAAVLGAASYWRESSPLCSAIVLAAAALSVGVPARWR